MPGIIISVVEDENWREDLFWLKVLEVCYADTKSLTIVRERDYAHFCIKNLIPHTEISFLLCAGQWRLMQRVSSDVQDILRTRGLLGSVASAWEFA